MSHVLVVGPWDNETRRPVWMMEHPDTCQVGECRVSVLLARFELDAFHGGEPVREWGALASDWPAGVSSVPGRYRVRASGDFIEVDTRSASADWAEVDGMWHRVDWDSRSGEAVLVCSGLIVPKAPADVFDYRWSPPGAVCPTSGCQRPVEP